MIIPIIKLTEAKREVVASAFIIDRLIITAGHTFHDDHENRLSNQYEFKIGGQFYPLGKPIHDEYRMKSTKYLSSDYIYEDLYLFKLPENVEYNSEQSLSQKCVFNKQISFMGYPNSELKAITETGRILDCRQSGTNLTNGDSNMRYFQNCIRVDTAVDEGFSGGPVFSDNEVYGMVVFGFPGCGTTAIKSEYILEKIKNPNNT